MLKESELWISPANSRVADADADAERPDSRDLVTVTDQLG